MAVDKTQTSSLVRIVLTPTKQLERVIRFGILPLRCTIRYTPLYYVARLDTFYFGRAFPHCYYYTHHRPYYGIPATTKVPGRLEQVPRAVYCLFNQPLACIGRLEARHPCYLPETASKIWRYRPSRTTSTLLWTSECNCRHLWFEQRLHKGQFLYPQHNY